MSASQSNGSAGLATRLTHAGRTPSSFHGFVNPPVAHASTVLFPDTATMLWAGDLPKHAAPPSVCYKAGAQSCLAEAAPKTRCAPFSRR